MKNIVKALILLSLSLVPNFIFGQGITTITRYSNVNANTRIEAPHIVQNDMVLHKATVTNITVDFDISVNMDAQEAFDSTVSIWKYLLKAGKPIKMKVYFKYFNSGDSTLAKTWISTFRNNYSGLPAKSMQYPISLAKQLNDTVYNSLQDTVYDMIIYFNDSVPWYFGTDGVPQKGEFDFMTVALHEMTHGLGFISSFRDSSGSGSFGYSDYPKSTSSKFPVVFDKFCISDTSRLINAANPSFRLAQLLTSNNVYFDGKNAKKANNGKKVKLYAPATWTNGTSISHLDDETFPALNTNSLMKSTMKMSQVIHNPGEVGLAILKDLGWSVTRLITFKSPTNNKVITKNQNYTIKWYDNISQPGDFINLELYKIVNGNPIDQGAINPKKVSTNPGSDNSYPWSVSASYDTGYYFIKAIGYNIAVDYGQTDDFYISDHPAVPQFNPSAGTYPTSKEVKITTRTQGGIIRYTLNGETPSDTSQKYNGPITVNNQKTIKAITCLTLSNGNNICSDVASSSYTINTKLIQANLSGTLESRRFDGKIGYGPESGILKLGKNGDTYRAYIKWTGIRNKIPPGDTIKAVQFYVNFTPLDTSIEIKYKDLSNINMSGDPKDDYDSIESSPTLFTLSAATHIISLDEKYISKIQNIVNNPSLNDEISIGLQNANEDDRANYVYYQVNNIDLVLYVTPNVYVDQVNSSQTSFGMVKMWNSDNMKWDQQTVPFTKLLPKNSNLRLKAYTAFETGTYQKFHDWRNHGILIDTNFIINTDSHRFIAEFQSTVSGVKIQELVDGIQLNNDSVYFKDPWLLDLNEPQYGYNNQDTSAPFKARKSPFIIDYNSSFNGDIYKGVFLKENPNFLSDQPIYSIRTPLTKTINLSGRNYTTYFQSWDTTNATLRQVGSNPTGYDQKAVVFKSADATVTANYKGVHLTDNSGAFSNTSQRKIVQNSYDGTLHMVYESMGKCWYERSTDNGQTWELVGALNGGRKAKNPSIDWFRQPPSQAGGGYEKVTIIYDGELPDLSGWGVLMEDFNKISGEYVDDNSVELLSDPNNLFTENHNSYPVIALGMDEDFMACWNDDQENLIYGVGKDLGFGGFGGWHTGFPTILLDNSYPVTNFSLTSNKEFDPSYYSSFYLAFELGPSGNTDINVFKLNYPSYSFSSFVCVDDYSGYNLSGHSTNPTIAMIKRNLGGELPIVAWIAHDPSNNNTIGCAAVINESSSEITNFSSFGNNVTSISASAPYLGDNEAIVTWSENNGSLSKYKLFQNDNFNSSMDILPSGKQIILSDGGNNTDDIKGYTLSNSSPYEIVESEFLKSIPSVISSNYTILTGSYLVDHNITVNSGATLTIQPGTILYFTSGASLVANGILNAEGTSEQQITFTAKSDNLPGSWGSIQINGSGASGASIKYANIEYGTNIDVINADNVTIENSSITNSSGYGIKFSVGTGCSITNSAISNSNTAHGIIIQGGASVTCRGNTIKKTNLNHRGVGIYFGSSSGTVSENDIRGFDWGLCAIWGASPNSSNINYPNKNNRITDCNVGVTVYRDSYLTLGIPTPGDQYGGNSIYGNSMNTNVGNSYPDYGSGLYACYNWWGTSLNTALFSTGPNAYFYYDPVSPSNLWDGIPEPLVLQGGNIIPESNNNLSKKTISNQTASLNQYSVNDNSMTSNNYNIAESDSNSIDLLLPGIILRTKNNFKKAKDFFLSYSKDHSGNKTANIYLYSCADKNTTHEIINYFKTLSKKNFKDKELLLSNLYLKEANIKLAKETNDKIIAKNPNSEIGIRAKLNNFYIALDHEKDIDGATDILEEVKKSPNLTNPMEIETAEQELQTYSAVNSKYLVKKQSKKENEIKVDTYSLSQNYPNPFNPTTTINYQIPNDGFVSIILYDILGRKVVSLVSRQQSQGRYSVNFDASKLTSGIYLYQLKVTALNGHSKNFTSTKKMVLIK